MAFYTTNATFNSTAFLESYDNGLSAPSPDVVLDYTLYHVPDGNTTVLISNGQIAASFDVAIVCDTIVLSTLQGYVGDSHTLDYSGGNITATLLGVFGARKEQTSDSTGTWRATLRFLA